MFRVNARTLVYDNPTCDQPIDGRKLHTTTADFFDKDGFELTCLEREYYKASGYPVCENILNHCCFNEQWLTLTAEAPQGFMLDHCTVLHRCNFSGAARNQLLSFQPTVPKTSYLLQCKQKWGLDLALDYYDGNEIIEVLHTEQDFHTSEECTAYKENIEKFVLAVDWEDAAKRLITKKDEWSSLIGFAQNDWKARFFGFPKAELTHKALT